MFLSDDSQLLLSPNAFGAVVEVTIERIAPTTSAPTAMSLPPVILRCHALLSNATFAVDGNMVLQTHINFPRFLPIFPDFLERLSHLAPIY
jgi:hypothetical protein